MEIRNFLCILFLMASYNSGFAQRGYVERAIEKNYENKYGKPGAEKGNEWINNKLLNVKVEPKYTFTKSNTIRFTSYKKGEVKEVSDIIYYFANNSSIVGFEHKEVNNNEKKRKSKEETFTIYDYKANAMIMLNKADKTGMAININAFMSKENIEKRDKGVPSKGDEKRSNNCTRTGKTKMIKGVLCEEWVCIDEERETRSELWVNNKVSYAMDAQKRGPMAAYIARHNVNGLIMEGLFYKRGELESKMETIDINNNNLTTINTTEYRINQ